MRFISTLCAAVVLVVASAADAGVTTQTEPFNGTPDFSRTLTFDQFDAMGGLHVLKSIEITVELNKDGGTLTLDNEDESAMGGTYEFGAIGGISSTDVSLIDMAFQPIGASLTSTVVGGFSLDPNDGDNVDTVDNTGPDSLVVNGGCLGCLHRYWHL